MGSMETGDRAFVLTWVTNGRGPRILSARTGGQKEGTVLDAKAMGSVVGEHIRRLREERGWSRAKLAYEATRVLQRNPEDDGIISLRYIERLETSVAHRPNLDRLQMIAEALDVPLSAILYVPPPDPLTQALELLEAAAINPEDLALIRDVLARNRPSDT